LKRLIPFAALLLLPCTAHAQDATARPWEGRDAAEFSLGVIMFRPTLGNLHFHSEGFHYRGHEIGLDSPSMWAAEIAFHIRHRWLALGIIGFIGGHPGSGDATPENQEGATIANTGSIMTYGIAADVAAVIPAGRYVSLRFGPVAGIRSYTFPLPGLAPSDCTDANNSKDDCAPNAVASVQPYLQPRARALFSIDNSGVYFGASLGYEIVGGGLAAGLFIGGVGDF
jgi:hypothetical protein